MIGALLRIEGISGLKIISVMPVLFLIILPVTLMRFPGPLAGPHLRYFFLFVVLISWLMPMNRVNLRRRFSEFQLMQPTPSSLMLGVRVAALCLHGLLPLAIAVAVVLFRHTAASDVLPLAANLGSAVVFASLVLHLPSPGYDNVLMRSKIWAVLALALAAICSAAWVDDPRFGLVLLAAAATLAWVIRRALPPGLLMAAAGERDRDRAGLSGGADHPRRHLAGWILRKTSLTGGNLARGFIFAISSLPSVWFAILLLIWLIGSVFRGLAGVVHLPLSRRQLFPYVAMPTLFWVVIGVAASLAFHTYLGQRLRLDYEPVDMEAVYVRTSDGESEHVTQILVPASHWRLGLGEVAPPTRAPWGEEVSPHTHLLSIWGRPIHLYNPYEISASSSIEFVSWQLSRAVEDVYGARISSESLRERYLEPAENGTVQIRPRTYTIQEVRSRPYRRRFDHPFPLRMDHPGLEAGPPRTPATILATGFLLCVLAWAPVLYCGLLLNRPPTTLRGVARRKWIVGGSAVLMFVIANGLVDLTNTLSRERHVPSAFEVVSGVTFRTLAEMLPENGLFSWAIVLLVTVAIYLFLGRRFSKMEIPQPIAPVSVS